MDRVFHSKINWTYWNITGVLAVSMLYFFWIKAIIPAALIALIELCLIEMIIHTQYVVTTEGKLKLSFGRFYPSSIISVGDILSIQSIYHFTASSADKIRIAYRGKQTNETVCISPVKKKEMITLLLKMNDRIIIDENLKKILS